MKWQPRQTAANNEWLSKAKTVCFSHQEFLGKAECGRLYSELVSRVNNKGVKATKRWLKDVVVPGSWSKGDKLVYAVKR
jgi:hypothetical protein